MEDPLSLLIVLLPQCLGGAGFEISVAEFPFELTNGPLDCKGLMEDVHAVGVFLHHPCDPSDVLLDRSQPIQGFLFLPRLTRLCSACEFSPGQRACHLRNVGRSES